MKTKILFSAGAKGGTGKTNLLKLIICWLQENSIEPHLIDADDDSASLRRYFPQAQIVVPNRVKSYDVLMHLVEKGEHPLIILDLKAGVGSQMLEWFADVPFDELSQMGVSMVCAGVITSNPDSLTSFLRWPDALGARVNYLLCKCLKDNDAAGLDPEKVEFQDYDRTRAALEFRKKFRPKTIIMPGLDPELQSELERVGMTIRDVLERRPDVPDTLSSLIVRSRLRRYQTYLYEQFDALKDFLLPEV